MPSESKVKRKVKRKKEGKKTMLQIELLNEKENKTNTLRIKTQDKIDELLDYFEDYQIETIKWDNYKVLIDNIDWIIDNNNSHDVPYLESLSVEELYNALECLNFCDLDELQKAQDIAEYEGISVFEVNINDFEQNHYIFESLYDYYDYCDEILEETNSDFFSSKLSCYFDYEKFHNECEYDCYIGSNGYVIIE